MWSESMERMGIVGICKEAGRLLHQHFRLFLPFFLAFILPASFLSVFYTAFLLPHNPHTNFLNSVYTTGHGEEVKDTDNAPPSLIVTYAALTPILILSVLGLAGFTYIVDYIYSDRSDDDAITKRVFKLLPHAFLRVFVTQIWIALLEVLLSVACALLAFLLIALFAVANGGGDPSPFVFTIIFVVAQFAVTIAITVVFTLSRFIAVLEQEKYGRKALKQSWRYVRARVWTVFGLMVFTELVGFLLYYPESVMVTAALPLATKVVAASVISVLFSFWSAYVALVWIVTYFVCKSSSDVAPLPVTAAENPYRPVGPGSTQIGEP